MDIDNPRDWPVFYAKYLAESSQQDPEGLTNAQQAQDRLASEIDNAPRGRAHASQAAAADARRKFEKANNRRLMDAFSQLKLFNEDEYSDTYLPLGDGVRVVARRAKLDHLIAYKSLEASSFANVALAHGKKMLGIDEAIARMGGDRDIELGDIV